VRFASAIKQTMKQKPPARVLPSLRKGGEEPDKNGGYVDPLAIPSMWTAVEPVPQSDKKERMELSSVTESAEGASKVGREGGEKRGDVEVS